MVFYFCQTFCCWVGSSIIDKKTRAKKVYNFWD